MILRTSRFFPEGDDRDEVRAEYDDTNVKVVEEMVNLIVAQRAYEINAKAVQAADEMMALSNNLRR